MFLVVDGNVNVELFQARCIVRLSKMEPLSFHGGLSCKLELTRNAVGVHMRQQP